MAIVLSAALMLAPQPADIAPCPPPLIHTWGVLCVTEAQYEALHNPSLTVETVTSAPQSQFGVERWRSMVAYYWGKHGQGHVDRMLRIMACESNGVPTAKNPRSSATGLFQIMKFWQKAWPGDYTDPWTNAAVAYQIWLTQGYGAWNASRRCWG